MKKMTQVAAALALALTATSVQAQEESQDLQPTFNYAYVGLNSMDFDGERINGLGIDVATEISPELFFEAQYLNGSKEFSDNSEIDLSGLYANLGYKVYNQAGTAVYVSAGLAYAKATISAPYWADSSEDDTGWNAQVGVRSRLTKEFEVDANVRHYSMSDAGSDQEIAFSGRYHVNEEFSFVLGYTIAGDDVSYTRAGISWHF